MSEIAIVDGRAAEADFDAAENCPTLTIGISDKNSPAARSWRVDIWARLPDGRHYVGALISAAPPSEGGSRILGYVCVPGTQVWFVRIQRDTGATATSQATLQIVRHHQTIPPGITPNGSFATVA